MLLSVENLRTHFKVGGGKMAKAVDGVSFHLNAGETLCVVGESGCGKSVTAFSIMQLLPRNAIHPSGKIIFDGRDILSMSVKERRQLRGNRMAMIFQEPGTSLNPVFRTGPQVAEGLRIHRSMNKAEAEKEVIRLFGEVGIPHPEARYRAYPFEMSGGMKQRVMIAMALACKPELLVADEPTTALDVTIQAQILQLIQDLQKERNMAVLMITHNLRVVNQVADRVMVMYAGRAVETAGREELFTHPQHPYTQQLLQAIPGSELRGGKLAEIPGRVPPATDFPSHCRFADRCESRMDKCRHGDPGLAELAPGHHTACFLHSDQEAR